MKNKDSKEAHWIDEIRVRRQSLYSNVILIETDDQGRIIELLEGFQKRAPFAKYDENEQENWFILDGWKGVMGVTPDPNNVFALNPLPDLQGGPYGIDPLLENIEEMLLEENTVLVIQNIYESSRAFNAALLSWASNDGIRAADSTIILFTPSRDIFPERVWGRMSIIRPPRSTADERHELLREAQFSMPVDNLKVDEETDGELAALTALTAGMTKDQLEAAAVESIIRYQELNMDSIAKAKERILADNPILEVNERPKFGFDGVGGYDRVKEVIRNYIVLPQEQPEYAKRFDVSKPRGIIFFGPPGTGKTLFVNSMAKELNMSVLKLQMEHILGKYVGESEKSMRLVFDVADAMSPCILFIDEIDKFSKRDMGAGTNQGSHVERELFSMLLEKLGDEKRKWLFVGATNIVEALDPALIRTGRVDSVIPIPFPDKEARKEIFNIHANKKRNPPLAGDIDLDEIAEKTHLWSGSDIEQLVVRTTNYVMKEAILEENIERKIQMDDVRTIIDSFNIDTKKNGQLQEKIKKQALEYTNDKRLINIFESAPKIRPKSRVRKGAEVMKKKRLDEKSRKDSKN